MRAVILASVFVLAGCNSVFGVGPTVLVPTDAAPTCPPIGTPPAFSRVFHQAVFEDCSYYTISESGTVALASCLFLVNGKLGGGFASGPGDSLLEPITLTPTAGYVKLLYPRIAPEGDVLLVQQTDMSSVGMLSLYRRDIDGVWSWLSDKQMTSSFAVFSAPSRGPERHVLVSGNGDSMLHELVGTDEGPWTEVLPAYSTTELGGLVASPTLTADGLRLLGQNGTSTVYADRPTIGARFSAVLPLSDVPRVEDLFMTTDCSRLYLSGLGNVLYLNQ
jgi:hypothetical protein